MSRPPTIASHSTSVVRLLGASFATSVLLLVSLLLATACASPGGGGSRPQPIQSAVLGGTQSAFNAKFGAATTLNPLSYAYTTTIQGTPLRLFVDLVNGSDGKAHVDMLAFAPPQGATTVWDDATASALYTTLLPSDATHVADPVSSLSGVVHVYRSAALAATFKVALFANTSNQPVAPGTFAVQCLPPSVGQPGSIQCQISLGELFT